MLNSGQIQNARSKYNLMLSVLKIRITPGKAIICNNADNYKPYIYISTAHDKICKYSHQYDIETQ